MGKHDIIQHSQTEGHKAIASARFQQTRLTAHSLSTASQVAAKRIEVELKMAVLLASSNIPLAFNDKLSPAIRSFFDDSKIADQYHSAATKATCMINRAAAPSCISSLLEQMKLHPFSLSIDGSNDSGLEKMNPITV